MMHVAAIPLIEMEIMAKDRGKTSNVSHFNDSLLKKWLQEFQSRMWKEEVPPGWNIHGVDFATGQLCLPAQLQLCSGGKRLSVTQGGLDTAVE